MALTYPKPTEPNRKPEPQTIVVTGAGRIINPAHRPNKGITVETERK
jgi:hypothetical protein